MSNWEIRHGDCLDLMSQVEDQSVDLILTDPPYFKVKRDEWDRQWSDADRFIHWLSEVATGWRRILRPNGSLYCFASPQMGWRVGAMLREHFTVLNEIRWNKTHTGGRHRGCRKETLRSFFTAHEVIFFCEQKGADSFLRTEVGYDARCSELRGTVFEPLRAYLDSEWKRAGLSPKDANIATGSKMASHFFSPVQWALPTREKYEELREYARLHGRPDALEKSHDLLEREYDVLRREYDVLRREYDELKQEFESLRRPFFATKQRPFTDTWEFDTVHPHPGKHPCEKPQALLEHIIETSSRPGALVLDTFAGSGSTGVAAHHLGRDFIGMEASAEYVEYGRRNIMESTAQRSLFSAQ